jgi:general secretion pathway protein H
VTTAATKGFTLLELLIVLAISAAIMALAVPRLSGLTALASLNGAARELAAALRTARGLAMAQHRNVAVILDARAQSYRTEGAPRTQRVPAGLRLTLDSDTILFFPDGSSTGGQIRVAAAQRSYVVDVDWLTGRVAIHE